MRYAFISDVHGNVTALNSVLRNIADHKVEQVICLGDMVGYGPDSLQSLRRCRKACKHIVLGNHDAAVAGLISDWNFSDRAKKGVERDKRQLPDSDLAWIRSLRYEYKARQFIAVHGTLDKPELFGYVDCVNEAIAAIGILASTGRRLLFVGHTHAPKWVVYKENDRIRFNEPADFDIDQEAYYVIDVGSVGYPRRTGSSSYVLYDSRRNRIEFKSVPFDFEAYSKSLERADVEQPSWLADYMNGNDLERRLS